MYGSIRDARLLAPVKMNLYPSKSNASSDKIEKIMNNRMNRYKLQNQRIIFEKIYLKFWKKG